MHVVAAGPNIGSRTSLPDSSLATDDGIVEADDDELPGSL